MKSARALARALAIPDSRSPVTLSPGLASVDYTVDDATATVRLPLPSRGTDGGSEAVAITFSGPLKKAQNSSTVFDETGIRGAASLGFSYAKTTFNAGDTTDVHKLSAICERTLGTRSCSAKQLDPAARREFFTAARARPPTVVGLSLQLGRQELTFVDPEGLALASQKKSRNLFNATAGVARSLGTSSVLFALTYRYGRSFKEADASEICRPLGTTGSLRCETTPLGVPIEHISSAVAIEARAFFATTALAPKVSYDVKATEFRVDVPIYLFRSETSGFVGGVALSASEGRKSIGYGVFISRPLGSNFW